MINRTFIGFITDSEYDLNNRIHDFGIPSTYIIKDFNVDSINKVSISIAALGVYSFYINGRLVNDEYMTQDCTEYESTITYRTYNISKYLVKGINRLGIILSDGWYASNLSFCNKNNFGDYPLKVCFEIKENGKVISQSDGSELAGTGPIRGADNQNGIIIDNNYDIDDFNLGYSPKHLLNHVKTYEVKAKIVKSILPPITLDHVFKPKLIKHVNNEYLFDCGQNFAGVLHSVFKGNKNDKVTIYHGEILDENNDLYTKNLRRAQAKDIYFLSGKVDEFLPRHTFHGFRYFKVVIEGNVEIKSIEAYAIKTKLKRTGKINTSNKLINRIYKNIIWGQKSNYLSIPTDCPQRDERMGWTGDAQIFAPTACYNFDCYKFLKNYLNCLIDSINEISDGVPVFSPYFFRKRPEKMICSQGWSDAIIIIPYTLYLYYGDISTLKRCYPYMKRYLKYVRINHINKEGLYEGQSYGDWLSVFEVTDKGFYDNAYYAYDNYLMSQISRLLNRNDSDYFNKEYLRARTVTRSKYFTNNKIANDTQGSYVLAYQLGVASLDEIKDNLIRKIEEYGHLTTGFHSTRSLLPILCEINRSDLAFKLINNKKYPSWGYEISCGATTIWERWDSYRKNIGFNKDGMNSFNHYSLGAIGEWIYQYMLGISPVLEDPGFKTCKVRPFFDDSVMQASGEYNSINGKIKVSYKVSDRVIVYEIQADPRVKLDFEFVNSIKSKQKVDENHYIIELRK